MFKKLLYRILILSITGLGSIDNIYASALYELLDSQNNTVVFENNVISCKNNILDTDDCTISNHNSNTIFININNLPIDTNTGVSVFANMAGSTNISLQDFDNTNDVPNIITFYGNNTKYSGTLYLHPAIDKISFRTNDSIIKKLNIPSNNNKTRNITMNIPNDIYASIINIPYNLSIKFYKNSKQIFPDPETLQKLKDIHPEYQYILKKYKITSKSYVKYTLDDKQQDSDEIFNKMTNIFKQMGIDIALYTQNKIVSLKFNESINTDNLLKAMIILTDEEFNKSSVKQTIINTLTKSYKDSFHDNLKKLGYTVKLCKSNSIITITSNKTNNVYEINLTGNTTFDIVKQVLTNLANDFTIGAIDEERKRIIDEIQSIKEKLQANSYIYKIKDAKNIFKVFEKLKKKVYNNSNNCIYNNTKNIKSSNNKSEKENKNKCADNSKNLTGTFEITTESHQKKQRIQRFIEKIQNNKENEVKGAVIKLFNTFFTSGLDSTEMKNNNLKNIIDEYCKSDSILGAELICTGTARWDWKECITTFNITSLKFKIGNNENNIIQSGESISIKKPYIDNSTECDIKERDILINLLQNNKLLYIDNTTGNKYVFNKVDVSGLQYYIFPSKFIKINNLNDYNYFYCLKCALNNMKHYDDYLGYYNYSNNNFTKCNSWFNNDNRERHDEMNCFDTNENYLLQLRILDKLANKKKKSRVFNPYGSETTDQKLYTLGHITDGWNNI